MPQFVLRGRQEEAGPAHSFRHAGVSAAAEAFEQLLAGAAVLGCVPQEQAKLRVPVQGLQVTGALCQRLSPGGVGLFWLVELQKDRPESLVRFPAFWVQSK